ncbi:MAG: hypothetical protein EAZ81_06985, partial [Verrucomicrobia bacterium]
ILPQTTNLTKKIPQPTAFTKCLEQFYRKRFAKPLVDFELLNDWVEKSLPRIQSWIKQEANKLPEKREIHFYSATGYSEDALPLIERLKLQRKTKIKFFDGSYVHRILKERCEQPVVDIFRE